VPEDRIVDEVRATYDGRVVLGNDLDIFDLGQLASIGQEQF
jgi:hypothetical protein